MRMLTKGRRTREDELRRGAELSHIELRRRHALLALIWSETICAFLDLIKEFHCLKNCKKGCYGTHVNIEM